MVTNTDKQDVKEQRPPQMALNHVHLLFENKIDSANDTEYLFNDLPRWLSSKNTQLTFTHAVDNYPVYPWLKKDPTTLPTELSTFKKDLNLCNERLKAILTAKDFALTETDMISMSEESSLELIKTLEDSQCELLVIGAKKTQCKRFLSSPFTTGLTAQAPCSVMLLRRPLKAQSEISVLFATDGSEAALKAAAQLPQVLNAQNIHVHLLTVQTMDYLLNPLISPYINNTVVEEALENNAKLVLEMTKEVLETAGLTVSECERVVGSPQWKVAEKAEELNPDLIVVGAHNRNKLSTWLLGSVSSRLLQASPCNLLVFR